MPCREPFVRQSQNDALVLYQSRNPARLIAVANGQRPSLVGLNEGLFPRKARVLVLIDQRVKYLSRARLQKNDLIDVFRPEFHSRRFFRAAKGSTRLLIER